MKITAILASKMSGSIAGVTASHNRGGMYLRSRTTPTNPSSLQQQAVRNAMQTLMSNWNNVLTQLQRDAWSTYGQNVARVDRLGESRFWTGAQWYCACNVPRIQAALSVINTAPTNFSMALLTGPGITSVTASTGVAVITFTNTNTWATAAGGALLVYSSRPQNPSIKYFNGPYRYAGSILGASTAPTSPQNVTIAFPAAVGNQVFFQFRSVNADGRISDPFLLSKIAV